MIPKMTHVAMRVRDTELREAETFYRELFDMDVAFRETMTENGWATLPDEDGWDFAERHQMRVGLVMLCRGGFAIDLEARPVPDAGGRFSHTGIEVSDEELERLRDKASKINCTVTHNSKPILVFDDPYGMRWEFTTLKYAEPKGLSAGSREGRWAADLVSA